VIADLLEKARNGDVKAEEALFGILIVRFTAFATRKIGEDQAEDIAQEACKIILQKYKTTSFEVGFEAWAYGVLKNTIRNYWHRMNVREGVMTSEVPVINVRGSSSNPDHELKLTLIKCLKKIMNAHPRYAKILNLVTFGYEPIEIQQQLEITKSNYYVMIKRGRLMLNTCLETGRI